MAHHTTYDSSEYDESGVDKLPSGLNVLTILTIISCCFWGLVTICSPFLLDLGLSMIEKTEKSGKELSAKKLEDLARSKEDILFSIQHMVPSMIIALAGIALCFLGALWMRKYKKDGFWIYITGELMPILATALIIGPHNQFKSIWSILWTIGIPVLFVLLYSMQRKHLVR